MPHSGRLSKPVCCLSTGIWRHQTRANQSFVCLPDVTTWPSQPQDLAWICSISWYLHSEEKKKAVMIIPTSIFWPLSVWPNLVIPHLPQNSLHFSKNIFLGKRTETQRSWANELGRQVRIYLPALSHKACLPGLYYEGSFKNCSLQGPAKWFWNPSRSSPQWGFVYAVPST